MCRGTEPLSRTLLLMSLDAATWTPRCLPRLMAPTRPSPTTNAGEPARRGRCPRPRPPPHSARCRRRPAGRGCQRLQA
eukprot:2926029-Alexandrium_andersonii.AAC.1